MVASSGSAARVSAMSSATTASGGVLWSSRYACRSGVSGSGLKDIAEL
jgi:hypothetical protein